MGRRATGSAYPGYSPVRETTPTTEIYPSTEEISSISRNENDAATTVVTKNKNEIPTALENVATVEAYASFEARDMIEASNSSSKERSFSSEKIASASKESVFIKAKTEKVIKSSANSASEVDIGHAFRQYHYAITKIMLMLKMNPESGCLDSGCSVTLMDRAYLARAHPGLTIRSMVSPITVRGLGANRHQTSKYVITSLYFPGEDIIAMTSPRKIHIVDDLKANILVEMDVMMPEQIDVLASQSKASINSCQMSVSIEVRTRGGRAVTHPMHVKKSITIASHSQIQILMHHISLSDRVFFFESEEIDLTLYAHLVDSFITAILASNNSNQAIKMSRNLRLGTI